MNGTDAIVNLTNANVEELDEQFGSGTSDVGRELIGLAERRYIVQIQRSGKLWVARAIPLRWAGGVYTLQFPAETPIDAMQDLAHALRER